MFCRLGGLGDEKNCGLKFEICLIYSLRDRYLSFFSLRIVGKHTASIEEFDG